MQTSASIAFLRQQWHLVWSFAAAHHLQGFDILCVQLCSSAYLACKELVFELLLFSYQIKAVWLVSFDHWHYLTRKSLEINISFKGNMTKISTSAQTRSKPNNARVTERSAKSVATVPVSSAFHNQLILVSYLLHVAYASLGETRDQTKPWARNTFRLARSGDCEGKNYNTAYGFTLCWRSYGYCCD